MNTSRNIANRRGVEQRDRLLPALVDGYFNVDEMSFEDLLSASVEFAAQIKYIGPNLNASGDWRSFLAANEIAIMAIIINKDTRQLHFQAERAKNEGLAAQVELVRQLIQEWNSWLTDLKRSSSTPARDLCAHLENIVRSTLCYEVLKIQQLTTSDPDEQGALAQIDTKLLADVWNESVAVSAQPTGQGLRNAADVSPVQVLHRATFEFITAIEHLKRLCRDLLPLSMKTQSHDPAVSLFITFLKLYRYAQDNLNSFTARHLDYYYNDILKARFRKKSQESVVVNFGVAEGGKGLEIEKGRRFSCAKDEKLRDVVFEATESLRVTDARVSALHTLRFERESMITPECDMNFITRIHRQDIPLDRTETSNGQARSWPLFGDGMSRGGDIARSSAKLDIGLAVASNVLFLEEGYRRITLDIELRRTQKPLSYYLENLERSSSRENFRFGLYELLLGWVSSKEHQIWSNAVPERVLERIEEGAQAIDRKAAGSPLATAGLGKISVKSCAELLVETIRLIEKSPGPEIPYLHRAKEAESADEFRSALGGLVVHVLFENGDASALLRGELGDRARELDCETSLESVERELRIGSRRLFKNYFGSAFQFHLSTEDGWLAVDRYDVLESASESAGMRLVLGLSADLPAITACSAATHGATWNTSLPLLKMTLNPEASLNVYSLLENFCLEQLIVNADVSGARNIVAYNNISQLDPSKPFYPFGPLPTLSSYMAIASPEAARKRITAFTVHLNWGDLPMGEDGFDGHYQGYASKIRNASFTTDVCVLSNGSWQPQSRAQIQNVPLFTWRDKKLLDQQTIKVEAAEYLRPIDPDAPYNELDLGLKTRNGFIKFSLASPESGFGHHEYPVQLSGTLESNAKKRVKKKSKLPNAPYTPLLNRISIDYSASSTINMNMQSKAGAEKNPETVYRLHPFGAEKVYPAANARALPILKPFDCDGSLLIGLSGTEVKGLINLYFSLSDDSRRTRAVEEIRFHWSYLGQNGWAPLSRNRVVSDGTKGFLCSGIVSLDLPEDMSNEHLDMPGSRYWLKVSTSSASSNFCSLREVKTHALKLVRSQEDGASFDPHSASLTKMKWQPLKSVPGLTQIRQIDQFMDVDKDESRDELITRVSERIRHRSRAVNPWDYERLILERFPIVGKVMCLPNRSIETLDPVPGNLLLIVTPRVNNAAETVGKLPRLSAVHLNDIRDFISTYCPPSASIEVANPVFEWVQVRCTAIFDQHAKDGMYIDRLDEDISRFLNPWENVGYGLEFNRPVKREDLYSYIYNLDYIRYLTDFSMLHITRSGDGYYALGDTVHQEIIGGDANVAPHYPWSLIVPLRHHYIEVSNEVEPITPDVTGIRELEIGSTFIIGGL
jgi:hypothetical protein